MTTGKTIALTRRTFIDKIMSLLLNMLSRLVITFLPRSKRLLVSWLKSPSAEKLSQPLFPLFPHLFNSQSYVFSSSHVQMWELDHKEGWTPKNWCFQTVVLENILESRLDCKEIKPVNPKGNQPWIFIGRTDTVAPILWLPDAKSWLTGKKTVMLGEIEGKRKRGQQRIRWFDNITGSMNMNLCKLHEIVKDREAWHAVPWCHRVGHT